MHPIARTLASPSLVLVVAAHCASSALAQSQPRFVTPRLDVGRLPVDVVVGDLDHDGHLDAIAINSSTDDASVLHGDGGGALALAAQVATGDGPFAPALADFDGDSNLDLLVTQLAPKTALLLKGDGLGGLAPLSTTPLGISADRLRAADVDLDGDLDAAAGSFATVVLLRSDGAGGFATSVVVSGKAGAFALGDVTGDAIPDLVTAPYAPLVLETRKGDGAGGFALQSSAPINGQQAADLVLGDLDHDGDLDAVLALNANGNETVVENLGGGAFQQNVQLISQGIHTRLALADETGDGQLDIVAFGVDCAVIPSSGAMTFAPPQKRAVEGTGLVADVDADGRLDFVTTHFDFDLQIGSVDVVLRDALGRHQGLQPHPTFGARAILDLDQDGDLDFADVDDFGAALVTQLDDGFADFAPGPQTAIAGVGSAPYSPVAGDVDNDGRDDLLVDNGMKELVAFASLGDGTFGNGIKSPLAQPVGTGHRSFRVADLDLDGSLDVVLDRYDSVAKKDTLVAYAGSGTGSFAVTTGVAFGAFHSYSHLPFDLADLDSDGFPDLIGGDEGATPGGPGRVSVALSTGAFHWGPLATTLVAGLVPLRVLAGDLDGDGDVDVAAHFAQAAVTNPDGKIEILHGDGAGALAAGPVLDAGKIDLLQADIALSDLDSDGRLDVVCSTPETRSVQFHRNTGLGFVVKESYAWYSPFSLFRTADLDQDGRDDLVSARGAALLQQPTTSTACPGGYVEYGHGCFGDSFFVPHLAGVGCPTPGGTMGIAVTAAPPAVVALLFVGGSAASVPLGYGCKLLLAPGSLGALPIPIGGAGVGGGGVAIYGVLPAASPTGVSAYLQLFAPTGAVPWGFASSNGLRVDLQ